MSSCANQSGGAGVHLTIVARGHVAVFRGWEHSVVIHKSRIEQEQITGEPNIFEIEDDAFLAAVEANDPSKVRSLYADACKTLAFCLAANESLETGEPVQVPAV